MSTLPGQASKGEKTKPKFQSLDINSLYTKVSRGENPEKQQQKSSSSYIKHGMQSLGKVPSARRPPANLPSLKSEHSGTDAAVPLVPPGAQGWGKQESTPSSTTITSQQTPTATTTTSQNSTTIPSNQQALSPLQLSAHQAAIALPVTNPVPHTHKQSQLSAQTAQTDKLWSSVTSGYPDGATGGGPHPPLYHSQQFQHEFPSLSSGDGGPTRTGIDALPFPTAAGGTSTGGPANLSLRPQTEGSWTQGGQRGNSGVASDLSGGQARPGSVAHLGGPPQLPPQVGLQAQQQSFPPQIRGVMPPFMYKGSFPQGSGIGNQNQNMVAPNPGPPVNGRGTHRPIESRPPRLIDREPGEEVVSRPIIKEEELNRMDEISKDAGWAESDEIDYSQKLAFSDDESDRPSKKETMKRHQQSRDQKDERYDNHLDSHQRQWNTGRSSGARGRSSEDEDNWVQSQTKNQIEIAVQKAKQRKEEEEKRFDEERKQGSAKKLMELEEKIQKRDKDNQEGIGTISPNSVPPKPINPRDIPLPDFQKEKEREKENIRDKEHRSRTPNDHNDDRNRQQNHESSFRQLTQIEGKNIPTRKHPKANDRDQRDRDRDMREQNAPSFSRSFKDDLPPRFTKQQRTNSSMNLPNHQFERSWNQNVSKLQSANGQYNINIHNRNIRQSPDIERKRDEDDRREYKRQSSEDSYRSSYHSQEISQKPESLRYEEHLIRKSSYESQSSRKDQEEDKRQKDKETRHTEKDIDDHSIGRASSDEWSEKREKMRDEKSVEKHDKDRERPQRPDSRDSRSTRHSRDSEPRDYMDTWTESYETSYEEKRRDHHIREDRRVVPGPITKDRIEADDMRNEKRSLTQLKKGQSFEVKTEKKPDQIEVKKGDSFVSAWADAIPTPTDAESAKLADDKKTSETHKCESKNFNEQMKKPERSDDYSRNRSYLKKSWNEYHPRPQGWSKRSSSRSQRNVRGSYGSDHHHGTDSEGSTEEHADQKSHVKSESQKIDQRSPKSIRKFDKDEKNRDKQEKNIGDQRKYDKTDKRDSYVPKGEPSRHGRGGSNFRSSRGGLGRRIEGYGPPPSKSPFGHHEEREKKCNEHQQSESPPAPPEDKTKQNQQALAAGIAGKRSETLQSLDKGRSNVNNRGKPSRKGKDDFCDTNSENSDEKNKDNRKMDIRKQQPARTSLNRQRNTQPPRMSGDKRSYETPKMEISSRQNSNGSLKKEDVKTLDQNLFVDASADTNVKNKQSASELEDKEEKTSGNGDTEGFQEVKSKKTVKERQKPIEEKQTKPITKVENNKEIVKNDRDRKPNKGNFSSQQLTQQQIQNIPSLMATPVNPPQVLPQPKSSSFHRDRLPNLAPRFAKQKLKAQLQHQQQQHQLHSIDINELNKPNQSIGMYSVKETAVPTQSVTTCAWDKPLGPQLRNMESDNMLGVNIDPAKSLDHRTHSNSQANSPNTEKILNKPVQLQDKSLLDGTTPPVNTIIFENTNFKSTPGNRNNRNEKPRSKLEDGNMENSVMAGFNKSSMNELLQNKGDNKSDAIQLPLFKEDNSDMKLDFFGSDLQFTDDKKNLCISSKPIHAITSGNNTVDSLDIKIASVKKVWETSEQESEEITFGGPPLDSNVFTQGKDTPDDSHEGYSPSPNQTASTTTNVCKVKPTQQVSGNGQTALSSTSHQAHSGIVASGLIGSNPLSPPPMPPVLGANVSIGPQQFTANQHIGYQASLSGNTQYGISAIPSPPAVSLVYNSTQPLQAAAAQTPVPYGAFQIDGVLSGQGRNQFSQYPSYHSLGQTASSPYPTQSVYLQTAPPHPSAAQAPPDLYPPNISNYRLSATNPFAQNQQLNNPTTVLISSTSNSLMSASVKPSNQQISAIGTKAGGVGQAYQQQSQQGQQVYMAYEPAIPANYLTPSPSVMQRGPAGPVQNNVVQALQPSSSFYSGSTGPQTGYFQQPGSSTIPSAQLQQHQAASFSLPGNVFGTPNQSHTNTGLQNFNSHFLTAPMQVAAALNAQQQYRSNLSAAYIKGVNTQMSDQAGRAQQLKSPSSQEVLSSVFNTGPQIPSPKSRQNPKHPPPQSSPTTQHKYNLYPGMGGQQNQNVQRYPTPIQRPVNFQQMQGNSMNQKHRNNPSSNKALGRQYYGGQTSTLSVQNEKTDDSKINENVALSNTNSASSTNKTATIGTSSANAVNTPSDKVKDNVKEETTALKE